MADDESSEAPEHHEAHVPGVTGATHALTKHLGPLPVWGWLVAGGTTAGLFLYLRSRGGGASSSTGAAVDNPTAASPIAAGGTFPGPAVDGSPSPSGPGLLDPGLTTDTPAPWFGRHRWTTTPGGAPSTGILGAPAAPEGPQPMNRSGSDVPSVGPGNDWTVSLPGGGVFSTGGPPETVTAPGVSTTVTNPSGRNDQGLVYGTVTPQQQAQQVADALAKQWNATH